MKIFTKRNALVGYLTLKAHSRARRRFMRRQKSRSGLKLVTVLVLAILSVGLLIAFAGVLHRRSRDGEAVEEVAAREDVEIAAVDDLHVAPESISAT
ncbi:MAG TPA: hypothetical protein VFK76_04435 [Gaiellaceae bacterium]|nr:hypothetical protein [Gaiellaceae bacterium]